MKYTLPKSYTHAGLQVNIPETTLKEYRTELGSTKAAVDRWLYENGYMEKIEYEAMTAKQAAQPRKKQEFKIDQEKADVVSYLAAALNQDWNEAANFVINAESIEIVNPNRLISFSLGNNKYELTLVRKKQPK